MKLLSNDRASFQKIGLNSSDFTLVHSIIWQETFCDFLAQQIEFNGLAPFIDLK